MDASSGGWTPLHLTPTRSPRPRAGNAGLPWRRLRALRDVIRAYGGGDTRSWAWTFVRNMCGIRRGVEDAAGGRPGGLPGAPATRTGPEPVGGCSGSFPDGWRWWNWIRRAPPPRGRGLTRKRGWTGPSPPNSALLRVVRLPSGGSGSPEVPRKRGFRVLELEGSAPFDAVGWLAGITGCAGPGRDPPDGSFHLGDRPGPGPGGSPGGGPGGAPGAGYRVREPEV